MKRDYSGTVLLFNNEIVGIVIDSSNDLWVVQIGSLYYMRCPLDIMGWEISTKKSKLNKSIRKLIKRYRKQKIKQKYYELRLTLRE